MGLISFFTWIAFLLCSIQASDKNIPQPFQDFLNLGQQLSESVRNLQNPLDDLLAIIGSQINEQINAIKALVIYTKMAKGVGGTTVIVYKTPKSVKFLIKNGETYICTDDKVNDAPTCASKNQFSIKEKEDYCYSRNIHRLNDNICILSSPSASLSLSLINGKFTCSTDEGHEVLVLKVSEYEKLCGRKPCDMIFTYYPDKSDPLAIKVPNDNPHVSCNITANGGCSFKGETIYGQNVYSDSNTISIIKIDV